MTWEAVPGEDGGGGPAGPPLLGVVIPTLDEGAFLPALLEDLSLLPFPHRVVVADGGSVDDTRGAARAGGARVVEAPRGRARQMNAGAAVVAGPWLLFLHADSRMPPGTREALTRWLQAPPPARSGHFRFRLEAGTPGRGVIEGGQRLRERLTGLAYGDQGLLVARDRFQALGGFPDLPLMEDVEMVRRLRRSGGLDPIPAPLVTSGRRYREEGWLRAMARNGSLLLLHGVGVPAERLARRYPPRRSAPIPPGEGGAADPSAPGHRTLLVFARAPRAGEVKTRLAASVGEDRALRIYRRMGREAVDRLRGGPWRTVLCFDPPNGEALEAVSSWLGPEDLSFLPQSRGDLGVRLQEAFRTGFRSGGPVCVVGTDIPGLDRDRVEEAFRRVEAPGGPDVVLGPATDGGYYLLATRSPAPGLFREIPWSTDEVRRLTLERAAALGLGVEELPPLSDVDRAEDLPPAYRDAP